MTFRWELSKLSHPLSRSDTDGGNWGAMTGRWGAGAEWGRLYPIKHWSNCSFHLGMEPAPHTHTMKDNFSGIAREVVAQGHWQNSQAVPQARGLCLQMFICK